MEEIRLTDILLIAKKKILFIVAIYFIVIIAVVVYLLVRTQEQEVKITYKFEWDGITNGLYLDKTRFRGALDMVDENLLQSVIDNENEFSHITVDKLINESNFTITPVVSPLTQTKIDEGEISVNYEPSKYQFSLKYDDLNLSENQAIQFINDLVSLYFSRVEEDKVISNKYFELNNVDSTTVENSYEETKYDYYDTIETIKYNYYVLLNKVNVYSDNETINNENILKLKHQIYIYENSILSLEHELKLNSYTKNDSIYRGTNIDRFVNERDELQSELDNIMKAIEGFNGADVPSYLSNKVSNLSSEIKDYNDLLTIYFDNGYKEVDAPTEYTEKIKQTILDIKKFNKENDDIYKYEMQKNMHVSAEELISLDDVRTNIIFTSLIVLIVGTGIAIGFLMIAYRLENEKKN